MTGPSGVCACVCPTVGAAAVLDQVSVGLCRKRFPRLPPWVVCLRLPRARALPHVFRLRRLSVVLLLWWESDRCLRLSASATSHG